MFATAPDSLADWRERRRLGIAIVAMTRMMATTISSSSSENPLFFFKLTPTFNRADQSSSIGAGIGRNPENEGRRIMRSPHLANRQVLVDGPTSLASRRKSRVRRITNDGVRMAVITITAGVAGGGSSFCSVVGSRRRDRIVITCLGAGERVV